MITHHLLAIVLAGCIVALAPSLSEATQSAQLIASDPAGRQVAFFFNQNGNGGAEALQIETHLIGNPGAKLSIRIDHSSIQLFSRVLTTEDCKYGDDGARCQFVIDGKSATYRQFVTAFERGTTAHIEVQNAGVMQMSSNISLIGFTRKLRPHL